MIIYRIVYIYILSLVYCINYISCLFASAIIQISQITSKDEGWYDCQVNTEPKLNSKSFLKVFEKGVLFDGGGGRGKSWRIRQSPIQESSTSPSSSYHFRSSIKPNLSTKPYHQLQDSPLRPSGVVPQIQKFLHPGNE